jgi:hypothetical protein
MVSSNLVNGLYIGVGPEHLLIPCGILGGIILTSNILVGLEKAGQVFIGPKSSTWVKLGSFVR